jgi:hypothetical protein
MRGLAAHPALPRPAAGQLRQAPPAEPRPTMERPRRILVSLPDAEPARAKAVSGDIINIQGFQGGDSVEIMPVACGPGVRT